MVACLQLSLCLVVTAALKGTPAQLKASISAVWLVRVIGYLMMGFNYLSPGYMAYTAQQHLSVLAGPILFNSIALIHLPKPYLYLGVQACIFVTSYVRLGMPLSRATAQSAGLHLVIILIHHLTERGFRSTFSAVIARQQFQQHPHQQQHRRQGSCKGGLAQTTGAPQAVQEAPFEKVWSSKASEAPPCPASATFSCFGSVKGKENSVTGPHLGTGSGMDGVHGPVGYTVSPCETRVASKGKESEAGVDNTVSMGSTACLALTASEASRDGRRLVSERMRSLVMAGALRAGTGRPRYQMQFQHHKLVLKVPGPAHPKSLPPSALPDLASFIHTRWVVGEAVLRMVLGADAKSWIVQGTTAPSQPEPGMACSIIAANPSLLLPAAPMYTTSADTATTQSAPELFPSSNSTTGLSVTLRAAVCVPAHMSRLRLMGWGEDAAKEAAPEGGSSEGPPEEPLQVLVNVHSHGYVPTSVRILSASPSTSHAAAGNCYEHTVEVAVSLPTATAGSADSTCPCLLTLELWHHDHLLSAHSSSKSCVLMLPSCMPGAVGVVEELQHGLPWSDEGNTDLQEFVRDLGYWVYHNSYRHFASPQGGADGDAAVRAGVGRGPSAWDSGVTLLRQSILWGLPALSSLLVDRLMTLPSAPSAPFARLAHAQMEGCSLTRPAATGAIGPALVSKMDEPREKRSLEEEGDVFSEDGAADVSELGGLLHLALLSPRNSRGMLQAVLEWGLRWGVLCTEGEGGGGSSSSCSGGAAGFAWRWAEPNALGFTPLDILASLPAESEVLDVEVEQPDGSGAVVRARDLPQCCKLHGSNIDSVVCGQKQAQPHPPCGQQQGQCEDRSSISSGTASTSGPSYARQVSLDMLPLEEQPAVRPPKGMAEWVSHLLCLLRASLAGSQQMYGKCTNTTFGSQQVYMESTNTTFGSQQVSAESTSTRYSTPAAATSSAALASPTPCASIQQGGKRSSSTGGFGGGMGALGQSCQQTAATMPVEVVAKGPSPCTAGVDPPFREAEFRAWLNMQVASMTLCWCTFQTLNCMAGMIRVGIAGGLGAFLYELCGYGTFFLAYAFGALMIWKAPQHTEAVCVGIVVCRALGCLMQGMGWLPIITSICTNTGLNLDAVVQILLMSTMEQVRVPWMMPLRALMVVCYGLWYTQAGKLRPWTRAVILNACGLAVNVTLDMRYRHLYTLRLRRMVQPGAGPNALDAKLKQT
ncbi:hypothetical protein DUNSADRAFT_15073 [Dunaliella salina]|nr:hypothetical protein DUNSADRAFT_15073 [Dunaliella salina]|eukprot:KAF5830054.1 hypothetical protein DUNSADRAFT_15073 [Dunaliella salina]